MSARALRLLSTAHLGRLRKVFARALDEWQAAWGIADGRIELAAELASPAGVDTETDWRQHWSAGGWCDWSADLPAEIARLVFPADGSHGPGEGEAEGGLAAACGAAAFDALVGALRALCAGDGAAVALLRRPDPDSARHGSGCVCVRLGLKRARLRVLLDADCVRRLLAGAAPAPLARLGNVPLRKALDRIPVALTVMAGEAEIGAGTMLTIGVGDVIPLPVALDGTLSVALPGGAELCRGYIGRRGDSLAVEIVG